MRYSIGCPGSAHAGTRTFTFTTGGGGSLGRQSSGPIGDSLVSERENGAVSTANSAMPKIIRTKEVVVFMDVKISWFEVRGGNLPHYQSGQSHCLAQTGKSEPGNVWLIVKIGTIAHFAGPRIAP